MKAPIYLNALRAFEASARHQSFAAAAVELNVTPAAVGQLVRTLEDWLGAPLFHRSATGKHRLLPTETAERALPEIRAGFDRLVVGLERLKEGAPGGVLTVTVSPAFAAKWLLPRIETFHAAFPDTELRLDTNLKPVDFAAHGIDVGVRYGPGIWPGLTAEKLMDEEVFPVCSPALLERSPSLNAPGDLVGQTLIHDMSMDQQAGFPSWDTWMAHAGVESKRTGRGVKINNSAAVLQTAIDGHGVALARSVMAHDDLAAGRLVRLFPNIHYSSPLAYFVVYRPESASFARLVRFRDWLLEQASKATPRPAARRDGSRKSR
jgi:LysR family glycine cleavage system transcriptional activator